MNKKEIYQNIYFKKISFSEKGKKFLTERGYTDSTFWEHETEEEFLKYIKSREILSPTDLYHLQALLWEIPFNEGVEMSFTQETIALNRIFETSFLRDHFFILSQEGVDVIVYSPYRVTPFLEEELAHHLQCRFKIVMLSVENFNENMNRYLNQIELTKGIAQQLEQIVFQENNTDIGDLNNENNPIVQFVNTLLYDSLRKGASDIHIERYPTGLKTKYRIDGVLLEELSLVDLSYHKMIISRIKILANLNIAEQRLPQDGRFMQEIEGRAVDFRVSIIPTSHGESAVIRILDKKSSQLTLEKLGANTYQREILIRQGKRPHGVILVTGPTGSGKTTTLYSLINEIKQSTEKMITIEDPVEYELSDVVQIPVNEKTGLTFAKGLRAILRQDPDRIMVGEIRDRETAEIAVQAALTGHLVLTTLHANSSVEVIGRLMNLGVDPYQFSTALNLIVSQRLMRVYCVNCSGTGCRKCDYTGFKGRKAVLELLEFDSELKEMIISGKSPIAIRQAAMEKGMITLEMQARERVIQKESSKEEFERIIGTW